MLSESKNTHQSHKIVAYPYQRRPVIVKGEDDSTEESLLFRKAKGINQNRVHSASDGNRRTTSNNRGQGIPREISTAEAPSYTTEDIEYGLSTKGQELYIVDGRESRDYSNDNDINRAQGIPAWTELGVIDDEDTSPFDNDVEWLLSAKDTEYKDYYDNKLRDTKDILLKDIAKPNFSGINLTINTQQSHAPDEGNKIGDAKFVNSKPSSPSTSKPASGRLSPKPVSPKPQKYYSWYEYRSPPRSGNASRRGSISPSPDKRDSSPKSEVLEDKSQQKKKKDKKNNQEDQNDPKVLLSKSMPVFPSSVDSSSVRQGSTSQESDRRSLQGLTHLVFEGNYTESPYVEHLTRPNHALIALQNPMFKNRPGMKGLNLASSPTSAKRKKMKAYAIIKDDSNQLVLSSTNPASSTKFPPIPSRNNLIVSNNNNKNIHQSRYNSNSLLESVYEKPDALYRKTKDQIIQNQHHSSFHPANALSSDRGRARLVNKRGMSNYPYQPGGGDVLYGNFINTHPTSPAIMRALSPPTLIDQLQIESEYSNNIDQLITTMKTEATQKNSKHSRSSPNVLLQNLFPNGRISPNVLVSNQKSHTATTNRTASTIGTSAAEGSEGRYDAMEMLSNIHIDPLYRIIRDEIEALLPKTMHNNNNSSIAGGSVILASSSISHHSPAFHANNIKTLTNFQSLPPSAWVICRIVYFLVMAYYETIIVQPLYLEYRKLTQLEPIWKILDRHYTIEKLNVNSIHQIFSWPYLQELMLVGNNAFIKLLEIIEFGAQLTSAQWRLFQDNVRKDLFQRLHHPSGGGNGNSNNNNPGEISIPIEAITNNEISRNLFYDLFPIPALGPLRMMVNAAKGFILAGAPTGHIGPSNGKPASLSSAVAPGTPLAVTITMTSWLKRIVALIYVSTTQRLKEVKVSPVPFVASLSQTPPEAFDQTVPLSSEPLGATFTDLNTGISERPTLAPPSMDTMSVMNKALLQENQFFPQRLNFLLILHHPSALRYPALPAYNDGRMMMNQNSHELSAIGEENSAVFRGVPAYFQLAAALVKPADELKILIMKPVTNGEDLQPMNSQDELEEIGVPTYQQQKNRLRDEFTLMKKDIKKHLRITSASPLHTVVIHPMENYYLLKQRVSHSAVREQQQQQQTHQNDQNHSFESAPSSFPPQSHNSNVVPVPSSFSSLAQLVQECFILHDGLTYCLQQSFPEFFTSSVASISSTSNIEVKKIPDILFTEFHIGKRNQPMIKVKKSTDHSTDLQQKAEEELKGKLTFSLGLINDSMSLSSGHVTRIRGSRYAICVTDSMNSWNAFELTKKVAKESDSIFLYHLPMISYWDLRILLQETTHQAPLGPAASLDHYQSHEPQPCDYQRSSLTYQQYQLLYAQIEQKKEKIVSLYRNLGYNVFIGGDERGNSSQEYMEIVQRLMKSYSLMMRYNAELYEQELSERQQQQPSHRDLYEGEREEKKEKLWYEEETPLPQERYLYYQYNEEMKVYCRKLLLAMTSLEADYVILGADPNDIFDSLSNVYENSFLQFEAYPIEEFTYDIKYITPVAPSSVPPQRSPSTSPPKLIQMASMTSQFAPSEVTSHEDYVFIPALNDVPLNTGTNDSSAVMSLFEDKAIILDQGKSQDRGEGEGGGSFGEPDDYEEDWSDERSQTKLNKAPTNNKKDSNPNENEEFMINNDQQAINNNTEYDLDSFIVEDNDEEGVDSLTASPFMLDRHHVTHAYELEREQLQHSHLHDQTLPDPIDNTAVGLAPQPQAQKIITRRRIAFNKKHLKYYQQYSERPVSFITMLLHEAMTIDQWADESNQSIAESVISPSSIPGGNSSAFSPTSRYKNQQNGMKKGFGNEKKEKSPLGFFSFILANSPFVTRDHHQSYSNTQQQPLQQLDHHTGGYENGNLLQ